MTVSNDNRRIQPTPAALKLALAFHRELKEQDASKEWVIGFSWAIERRMREPKGGPMRNLGPGLDLAAYDRRQIDASRLRRADGLEYIVDIPAEVARSSRLGLIDRDDGEFSQLVLR
jgi:hypothetical protein